MVLSTAMINNIIIGECDSRQTHNCDQICSDTDTSYTCSCRSGYRLASDGYSCNGKSKLMPLQNLNISLITSIDVDECRSRYYNPCRHFCMNTIAMDLMFAAAELAIV